MIYFLIHCSFQDISVRGFWLSRWIDENLTNPDRIRMYEELGQMMRNGELSAPKNEVIPMKNYKDALKKAKESYKKGKVIIDLTRAK